MSLASVSTIVVNVFKMTTICKERYTLTSLQKTLSVFRVAEDAEQAQQFARNIEVLRDRRSLRAKQTPTIPKTPRFKKLSSDSNDDDEEYDPESGRHCKKADNSKLKSKRRAEGAPEGERPAKKSAKPEPTRVLSQDERRVDTIAFMTLMLMSEKSREVLNQLVRKHHNSVTKKVIFEESNPDTATYFDQLDEEAEKIDNIGGRALRNRKVPEIIVQKCRSCSQTEDKCECVEQSIQDNPDTTSLQESCEACGCPKSRCQCNDTVSPENDVGSSMKRGVLTDPRSLGKTALKLAKGKSRAVSPAQPSPGPGNPNPVSKSAQEAKKKQEAAAAQEEADVQQAIDDSKNSFTSRVGLSISGPSGTRAESVASSSSQEILEKGSSPALPIDVDSDDAIGRALFTPWSHPIDFQSRNDSCKFCEDLCYGPQGEPYRHIKVVDDPLSPKTQFIEVSGDLCGHPTPRTRMCVRCALKRVFILDCLGHEFEPLQEPSDEQYQKFLEQANGKGSKGAKSAYPMCSICKCPARLKCGTYIHRGLTRQPMRIPKQGCGYHLCQGCHLSFGRLRGTPTIGQLQDLQSRRSHGKARLLLRADAEFLCKNWVLRQAYVSCCPQGLPKFVH
jgi:hypothetical protein